MQAAALVYKVICAQAGQSDLSQLTDNLSGQIQKDELEQILGNKQLFVVCSLDGKRTVIAKTQLKVCKARDCNSCSNLHLCKLYLFGEDCPHNRGRRVCRFSHDLYSDHNSQVLQQHYLQGLHREELCTLLLQNDNTLLPPVCFTYNRGTGEFGFCPDKDACWRLHICEKYLRGTCHAGDCDRSHDFFEPHPMRSLKARGVSTGMVGSLLAVYQNTLAMWDTTNPGHHGKGTEICLYHIKNYCKQGNRCGKVHFHLPYRWEFKDGKGWSKLEDNEAIEQDFCDPSKTYSGGKVPVHFDTMTRNSVEVRRISTASSVTQPNFILTTKWAWYWEDQFGQWIQYASSEETHHSASITSEELEKRYLEDNSTVIEFTAGKHTYELSMQDMIQSNKVFGTKRLVRRRPIFVSATDVSKIKSSSLQVHKSMPHHWDKLNMPETGFKRVQLERSSKEYASIVDLFSQTMSGFRVTSIERVQNRGLWEVFQWQADQMRKSNSGKTNEKILFHGTDSKHIDAICQQNFDWRICGTHGTAYGRGSYFARDARYSHKYTSPSATRSMFACRVLLGTFTRGTSDYVRPPPKEDDPSMFYDSCVNSMSDPSIFVVFEKHQVYPEYLIQYTEDTQSSVPHISQSSAPLVTPRQSLSNVTLPSSKLQDTTVDTPFIANVRVRTASAAASHAVSHQPRVTVHDLQATTATSAIPAANLDLISRSSSLAKRDPDFGRSALANASANQKLIAETPHSHRQAFTGSTGERTLSRTHTSGSLSPVSPTHQPAARGGFISNLEAVLQRAQERRSIPDSGSRIICFPSSDVHPSVSSQARLSSPSVTNTTSHQDFWLSGVNDQQLPSRSSRRMLSSLLAPDTIASSSPHVGSSNTTKLSSETTQGEAFSDLLDYFQKLSNKK